MWASLYSLQRSGWWSLEGDEDDDEDVGCDTEGQLPDAAAVTNSDELADWPSVSTKVPLVSVAVVIFAVDCATGLTILTAAPTCRSPAPGGQAPCI